MDDTIHFRLKGALLSLAEEKEYTRAAQQLGITPAQLREDISELERRLCIKLDASIDEYNTPQEDPAEYGETHRACPAALWSCTDPHMDWRHEIHLL